MTRFYRVVDIRGERAVEPEGFPLSLGGAAVADIVLPGCPDTALVAYLALSDGHAYIQPAGPSVAVFHNHEQLHDSTWLKSGDQVHYQDAVVDWLLKGDRILIKVGQVRGSDAQSAPVLQPPASRAPLPVAEAPSSAGGSRALKQVIGSLFVVLLLVAGFVLLATPVAVVVTPEPERQSIRGFPPPLALGERILLWPGKYRLRAERKGYSALDEVLSVQDGGPPEFSFFMTELPGLVKLDIQPAVPFELVVDGEPVALDGTVARIERGTRTLGIQTGRYLPIEQQIDIQGFGEQQQVSFTLSPAWAETFIETQPPGAGVRIDGEPAGVTPLKTELLQGERSLLIEKALYKTLSLQQTVIAGQPVSLTGLSLEPADGQLVLESEPQAATIQVDGEFHGTTPATLILSSTQTHQLRLSKPGYVTLEQAIELAPEDQQTLTLSLAPEYGTVFISSHPADAKLRVDGKVLGKATRRLRLTTRPHRLEIYKPGYTTYRANVTPSAPTSQNLEVTLKTEAMTKSETTPEVIQTKAGQLLRLIRPGGSFEMGASRREAGRRANESRRLVQLERAFYFGEKEVTNAEYRLFRASHSSGSAEGVNLNGKHQPVVNLSWDDAARYCNWLSKKHGLAAAYREQGGRMFPVSPPNSGYRMPSEAEWAYMARVFSRSTPLRYPWVGQYPPSSVVGNFADAQISDTLAEVLPGYNDGFRGSAPVASFAAFPTGFYDLGGNVAEWTNDFYKVYPGGTRRVEKDPQGPAKGEHHVVRGSSWRHGNITELRLSYRDYSRQPRSDLGFRLARYAE